MSFFLESFVLHKCDGCGGFDRLDTNINQKPDFCHKCCQELCFRCKFVCNHCFDDFCKKCVDKCKFCAIKLCSECVMPHSNSSSHVVP